MASESVKVVVRCRPMNERERALNCKAAVTMESARCQCFIQKPGATNEPPKQFTFDGTYYTNQTTEQMYNEIAYPLVEGVTEGYNGTIFAYGQTGSGKSFTMQGITDPPAQRGVIPRAFEHIFESIQGVTEGYNGTIFAYGQTGSGKSFTMQGITDPPSQRGVIPRAFEHIFESIQCAENTKFLVRASYLEIYNEEIRDLLGNDTKQKLEFTITAIGLYAWVAWTIFSPLSVALQQPRGEQTGPLYTSRRAGTHLPADHLQLAITYTAGRRSQEHQLKEHPERGVYVKELSLHTVHSVVECERIMEQGWKNRSVGYTLMNKDSSRSHSIFTIHLEISTVDQSGEGHLRAGKLNLVDLAGSERQSKTGATGERLREATKINLSLSALGNVISALVDGRSRHIPYRDSKLTRMLQDSLGGNTRTLMVACLSPADNNYEESLSTLRYANRAKSIQNRPRINEDPKDALLREYQEEIKQLRALLTGQIGDTSLSTLLASKLSGAPPAVQPKPPPSPGVDIEAEKAKIRQEYEEKLARVQADYTAEKQCKVKLQEDITALQSTFESKLARLEEKHTQRTAAAPVTAEGSSEEDLPRPGTAVPLEVTAAEQSLAKTVWSLPVCVLKPQSNQPQIAKHIGSVQRESVEEAGAATKKEEEGEGATSPAPLDPKQVLERLQQLEQEVVGGEQARNEKLREQHKQRQSLADQRKKQLVEALAATSEESDSMLLNVYDSIQEEVHAKSKLLEDMHTKLRAAEIEIADLQSEFEFERIDYLATIRRLEREGQLTQQILERVQPLVRRDCNYSNVDRVRREAVWDEDSATWRLPEAVVLKTSLPAAVPPPAQGSLGKQSGRRNSSAENGEFLLLRAADIEIADLQSEFEFERIDYLATIRRLEREGQLTQQILERVQPLVRRDCNYSNVDRVRREAVWDEDSATWRLPEAVVLKTSLPAAVPPPAQGSLGKQSGRRNSSAENGEFLLEEDRYKQLLNRRDSESIASNYFKSKRASQILNSDPMKSLAVHPVPLGNGTSHLSPGAISPTQSLDVPQPRPYRLESLELLPAATKTKRKKSKTNPNFDGP
ncbi:UNVERIFIED_CONTAM: hypothetical protein FKN15_038830 [Acipenser sinensis]